MTEEEFREHMRYEGCRTEEERRERDFVLGWMGVCALVHLGEDITSLVASHHDTGAQDQT